MRNSIPVDSFSLSVFSWSAWRKCFISRQPWLKHTFFPFLILAFNDIYQLLLLTSEMFSPGSPFPKAEFNWDYINTCCLWTLFAILSIFIFIFKCFPSVFCFFYDDSKTIFCRHCLVKIQGVRLYFKGAILAINKPFTITFSSIPIPICWLLIVIKVVVWIRDVEYVLFKY